MLKVSSVLLLVGSLSVQTFAQGPIATMTVPAGAVICQAIPSGQCFDARGNALPRPPLDLSMVPAQLEQIAKDVHALTVKQSSGAADFFTSRKFVATVSTVITLVSTYFATKK